MKYISLLALLLLPLLSFGQTKFAYSISRPYKVIDSGFKLYLSDTKNQIVIGVKYLGWKGLSIQRFDAKAMKEVHRNVITELPKGMVLENVDWLGDRVYLYYSQWDKPNTTEQLFCQEIDTEKCTFKGEPKRLIAVEGKLTGTPAFHIYWVPVNSPEKFTFLKSHDDSKILIQSRRKPAKRNDAINHDIIVMYVFDKDLKKISGNEIKMPYTEQAMDNLDYHLNSEGIPYLLARVRADGSDKSYKGFGAGKQINHHIELLKFDIPAGQIKVTKIQAEGYLLKDLWLYDGPNNNMICAGFYTATNTSVLTANSGASGVNTSSKVINLDDADGAFIFDVNSSGGINKKSFHEIPVEVINQYERAGVQKRNEKKDKKGRAQFQDLTMKKFSVQEDNSILIIGEQFYTTTHTVNGRTYYIYHYDDMLMTKIDPQGKLSWMRKLPKRQESSNPRGGVGFKHITLENKHYVIFLDNVKNMSLKLDQKPAKHVDGKGGFLTAYGVEDATGKVSKISIFDTKDAKGIKVKQFSTYRMIQCSKDEFILEAYKGQKEDVMIKIKVK